MPFGIADPLQPLLDARSTGAPVPSLLELGGVALLAEARDLLLDHDELPTLVGLACDDTAVLDDQSGRDFLLAAAEAPEDPLLLEEVVATFLAHRDVVRVLGEDLVDVWLDVSRTRLNLLGGIALEASARVVLANAASSYGLLDRLRRIRRELRRADDDFAGRAVRVAGAVAEHFSAPEIPGLLEELLNRDDVADDAAFELGMLTLRQALTAGTLEQAHPLFLKARQHLRDAYCDEERSDAAAFGTAIDAVLAYSAGALVSEDVIHRLQESILDIRLNLLGLPPGWRTPRFDTLSTWQCLLDTLYRAQDADRPGAWLRGAAIIGNLVDVYAAHRSLDLFASGSGTNSPAGPDPVLTGLHGVLAPRVERTLLARENGLALLDEWLEELGTASAADGDPSTPLVREQATALRRTLSAGGGESHPKADRPAIMFAGLSLSVDDTKQMNDFLASAPHLAERLNAMWEGWRAKEPVDEVPIIATTYRNACTQLQQQCPDGYTGQFAADIDRILLYLLRFLDLRLSETQRFGGDDRRYLRRLKKDDPKPLEKELGKDLRDFLGGQGLRVDLEGGNVGGGRVDVAWRPHDELITLELKRDWKNPSWDSYARAFLPQVISYQVSGPPVNFLVVLDLTEKPDGLASISACVHVRTVPGPAGDPRPRTVIMLRVQGNKRDPHDL
ncbi:hypothetical protein MXD61_12355 [Frankia sp. AgPm24]|uniref:hypothetical protein n=1 Tax=Frankia sp. AgPm24 TaxID=631128 RepID=UPI0020103E7C|nr:hypothetical protein [Frankia sp. AgPm24]MCK9922653.1 hypothetical protein [Frankia sp. AgPm24]